MRILKALVNSVRALNRGLRTEPALRQEAILVLFGVPIAYCISDNAGVLVLVIAVVFAVECLNTALEKLCDKINPDIDERIGYIKDLGSLAVLVSIIGALSVWLPELWFAIQRLR